MSRRIDALEARVGRRLVRRMADGASCEPSAVGLLRVALRTRDGLAAALRDANAEATSLRGTIRVSAGPGFLPVLTKVITDFRAVHRETSFEVILDPRAADLTRREADLGVRTTKVEADGVVVRRAGSLPYGLFASEAYVRGRAPLESGSFGDHTFVGYEGALEREPAIAWLRERGAVSFPISASSLDAVAAFARAGHGIAPLPVVMARSSGLVRVGPRAEPPGKTVDVAYHREQKEVARIAAFADAMMRALLDYLG